MRRVVASLLAVLTLASGLALVLTVMTASSGSAITSVDPALGQRDCALTGRVYVRGAGCARHRCVSGAKLVKEGVDAELCERRGPGGSAYGQPINSRRCRDLGRIWIGEVNICASNPDRHRKVLPHARQCTDPRATYVTHSEEEGYYDECLSPNQVRKLQRVAKRQQVSLAKAALDRNRFNCSYRPAWVMRDGRCVPRPGPPPSDDLGGFFVTGDSVSWRAWDELHGRVPGWELDLRPGRRLDELAGRLDWYRANHGEPDRVIIQLGTNRRAGFNERDFRATMATIKNGTPVLMMLPYREFTGDNANLVAATKRYVGWMRSLAADRPMTCLADWPAYAAKHSSNLVDGEHPDRQHEDWYARYLVRAWSNCERQLGL